MADSKSLRQSLRKLKLPTLQEVQWERCRRSFLFFVLNYCMVEAKEDGVGGWTRFDLWEQQREVAQDMQAHRQLVILKARQLGLSWLSVAFALWLLLFHPIATVLLYSYRDKEARKLMERLRGMHDHLPRWMRMRTLTANEHEWKLANESTAIAMVETAGDSYTATLVLIDEADLLSDLGGLMDRVKPTIADGGRMVLVSRSNKERPESSFKNYYAEAAAGRIDWKAIFLPWHSRPDRTQAWYDREQAEEMRTKGHLDDFHGNYPATDAEALSGRTLDKRIPPQWLEVCRVEIAALPSPLSIPGLTVYRLPVPGRRYVLGADPAEGNPTSDDSAAEVLDVDTGEEVASLAGRFEPAIFADYTAKLARYFNQAACLCERNNHGHAVLLWWKNFASDLRRLQGDDGKDGWNTSALSKSMMYSHGADAFRNGEVRVYNLDVFRQLASIEGGTLSAPTGQKDDRATAFLLACLARLRSPVSAYKFTGFTGKKA